MEYNYNALRFDILNFLDMALMEGFLDARDAFEMTQNASNEQLLKIAEDYEFDVNDYIMPSKEELWTAENKRIK